MLVFYLALVADRILLARHVGPPLDGVSAKKRVDHHLRTRARGKGPTAFAEACGSDLTVYTYPSLATVQLIALSSAPSSMAPVILQALRGLHETLSSQIDPYIPEGILNKALEVSQIIEEHWIGGNALFPSPSAPNLSRSMLPDRMEYSPQVYIDVEEVISMVMDPSGKVQVSGIRGCVMLNARGTYPGQMITLLFSKALIPVDEEEEEEERGGRSEPQSDAETSTLRPLSLLTHPSLDMGTLVKGEPVTLSIPPHPTSLLRYCLDRVHTPPFDLTCTFHPDSEDPLGRHVIVCITVRSNYPAHRHANHITLTLPLPPMVASASTRLEKSLGSIDMDQDARWDKDASEIRWRIKGYGGRIPLSLNVRLFLSPPLSWEEGMISQFSGVNASFDVSGWTPSGLNLKRLSLPTMPSIPLCPPPKKWVRYETKTSRYTKRIGQENYMSGA